MASHRSLSLQLPTALLLLLLPAVSSSFLSSYYFSSSVREKKPHVEPADEAGYRTYIVFLLEPPPAIMKHLDADSARAWHQSFLPSLRTSLGEPRLQRSYYSRFLHGFAARLTEEELELVSAKPGFVRAFPNRIRYLD